MHDRQRAHFQNCYIYVAPAVAIMRAHILRWTSRRSSRWCVDSHAIVASVVASHVACLIALVCFALNIFVDGHVQRDGRNIYTILSVCLIMYHVQHDLISLYRLTTHNTSPIDLHVL